MANIRVDLDFPIIDGSEAVFIAPCDCSDIAGLVVYYPSTIGANATTRSKEFIFKDAHGSDLSGMDHLFKTGVYVKVLLNVTEGIAYIQNADTNSYIEGKFSGIVIAVNTSKWVKQDDGTYTNTVAAEQIIEGDLLDASLYGEYTEEQAEAFDFLIESIEAQNGKVVFTASEKIEVSLSILLRGRVNMEEKNVFVHDLKAASIEYNNTKSGLKATNPQDAIDELATSISGLVVVVTADGWNTQDDGTFRKIIPVEQITGDETFDISLYPGDIPTEEQVVAFSEHVTSIETSEGAIILTASEEINVQFRIFLYGKVNFDNNVVLMKEYSAVDIAFDDTVAKLDAKNIQEADVALALRPVNNNILINSNFANPVNQRNITELSQVTDNYKYFIDRWCCGWANSEFTAKLVDGGVQIINNSTSKTANLFQRIEFPEQYLGKYVTLQVCIDNTVYVASGILPDSLPSDGTTFAITNNCTSKYNLIIGLNDCFFVQVEINSGYTSGIIQWAKFELGEVATPYVPRLYAEELQLCQRYYQIVNDSLFPWSVTTYDMVFHQYFNPMRVTPTISVVESNIYLENQLQSGFTFRYDHQTDRILLFYASKSSHGLKGKPYLGLFLNVVLDAEL